MSGPLPSIDVTRNPHQVSHLQQVHISRVLGLERERENKEKGVCTNGSGSKGVCLQWSRAEGGERGTRDILIGREEEREKREEGISEPLVHPVTKDREGAGNPEITKVKKRSSCTEGYIYTH